LKAIISAPAELLISDNSFNPSQLCSFYADDFYKRIEAVLGQSVVDAKNVYKLFSSFEDENNWINKAVAKYYNKTSVLLNSKDNTE
jgi:hypothetical protein